MTYSREYMFILDGVGMNGTVFACQGFAPKDPEEYIDIFRNCNKSRIQGIVMVPSDLNDNKYLNEKCKVYIAVDKGIADITIEGWSGERLFHYSGEIDNLDD